MPPDTDPEKYSIDEMMERLKNRASDPSPDDGELVTREDGTVALKVRKRKRRTRQPHKEKKIRTRRARVIQASVALVVLFVAILSLGAAIVYANSAAFRENTSRMIAARSGAEVGLEQFRVSPTRAIAGRISLAWPSGKVLKELTARGVSASISPAAFLGKSLTGEDVAVDNAVLRLGFPESGSGPGDAAAADASAPLRFKRYSTQKLVVLLGQPERPALVLRDAEASFEPVNANNRPQVLLNGGTVETAYWPALKMYRAHIEMRDNEIDVLGMRLLHEDDSRGMIDLMGTIAPHAMERPPALAVRLESFPLAGIIGGEFGSLINGRIDTVTNPQSNLLVLSPGLENGAGLNLTFQKSVGSPIELKGFKFLADFARLFGDEWFERPVFELEARGGIRRSNRDVVFEDLSLEHKGRMAVRGRIASDTTGQLSGAIRVGVTEAALLAAENSRLLAVFGPEEDGYRWLSLEISGNCKVPQDNFLKLYEMTPAARDSIPGSGGVPSFDELIAPE